MTGFNSPDVPAYINYLIVFVVGTLVAQSSVTTLLEKHSDRWAFLGTWSLFFAYVADRFDERVRAKIAANPEDIKTLEKLVRDRAKDSAALDKALQGGRTDRQRVDVLWSEFRTVEPETYGRLLKDAKLVPWGLYFRWKQKGQAKLVTGAIVLCALGAGFWTWHGLDQTGNWRRYYRWRFFKPNVSDRDRFRTYKYYAGLLRGADAPAAADVLTPLLPELRYEALPIRQADDLLGLLEDCHSPALDLAAFDGLIEGLQTRNPDVRVRVQKALAHIAAADFPATPADADLQGWIPGKDDTVAAVDGYVLRWRRWLVTQKPVH